MFEGIVEPVMSELVVPLVALAALVDVGSVAEPVVFDAVVGVVGVVAEDVCGVLIGGSAAGTPLVSAQATNANAERAAT